MQWHPLKHAVICWNMHESQLSIWHLQKRVTGDIFLWDPFFVWKGSKEASNQALASQPARQLHVHVNRTFAEIFSSLFSTSRWFLLNNEIAGTCWWFPRRNFAHCADEFARNSFLEIGHEPKIDVKYRNFYDKEKIYGTTHSSFWKAHPTPQLYTQTKLLRYFLIHFFLTSHDF